MEKENKSKWYRKKPQKVEERYKMNINMVPGTVPNQIKMVQKKPQRVEERYKMNINMVPGTVKN
jgi:hypothetical protein